MSTGPRLGYLGFEVRDVAAWKSFATSVLGLELASETTGLSLRMDDWAQRFFVIPGDADDLCAMGWEVDDARALDEAVARLRGAGIDVSEASREEAALRKMERVFRFRDPASLPSEIGYGPAKATAAFRSPAGVSGFVTGNKGLGHAVINARSQAESQAFYCDVLGFKLSDHIICDIHGYHVDIAFFHSNARHHTVAFGAAQKKRIHHFMIEAKTIDDVGLAYDRALRAGVKIVNTLGKHPNDRMFSFYAKTPSGFQFEFGYGGREVDDATWTPTTYDRISEWGHHPPEMLAPLPKEGPR
jgi:2,3-dihydroxybiphenyl 1,2-dioxygenase